MNPQIQVNIGDEERTVVLEPLPFMIGRRPSHPLAIPLAQISRDHAQIVQEDGSYILTDLGSVHGTLVNGARITRHALADGDAIEIPNCPGVRIVFNPPPETASLFLSQFRQLDDSGAAGEFGRLRLLLDFGRLLRSTRVLEDVLGAMVDTALRLTGAERGFVFLRGTSGTLDVVTGRTASGATVAADASAISRSILERAAASAAAVVMTDRPAGAAADLAQSIVRHDLRTVVAVPLRDAPSGAAAPVLGVLYLDSRAASPALGRVSRELLDTLTGEAAQLLVNAQLMRQQEAARALEQEMALATTIQQCLMATALPELAFARLRGTSQACHQIGGDFFDAVPTGDGEVAVVLADVSGKGAAAALLASSLQGIVHAQLLAGMPLVRIAATANRFICQRLQGEKYATLLIVRLLANGEFEYLNCGHIAPLVEEGGGCRTLTENNMPVGLIPTAEYASARGCLQPGARMLLVTDGVTEAANPGGEMFGNARLADLACAAAPLTAIAAAVVEFCQGAPLADDVTLVEIAYGEAGGRAGAA